MTVLIPALAAALVVTACSGGQQHSSSSTTTAASPAATSAAMHAMKPAASNGAAVYNANCSSCHQANGKGSPGAFPPLAGNAVVTGPAAKVIHIVKNGLTGTIKVGSATYNGQMPAWKSSLKDPEIAAVVSYIRSSWGNHAPAVTAAQVASTK
ncbi:MAG: cytochrome c [Candidatus Baltobacteraceae bacterium]